MTVGRAERTGMDLVQADRIHCKKWEELVVDNDGREWLIDAGGHSSLSRVGIDLALGTSLG